MEDFSPPNPSTFDFLKNLEEVERAVSTFSPGKDVATRTMLGPLQRVHKFTFFGDVETEFLLRFGYLIQVRKGKDPGWSCMDFSPKRYLQECAPALAWTGVHLKGNEIQGWVLDLDQDLVAISLLP